MGEQAVTCLVATDDESFTYNKRISRLATIQEHKMILRAVQRGVSEARIAAALNVNVGLIQHKRTLLNGICPEAAELLKAKHCPLNSFRALRKMRPLRQIQAAELMIAANNYTVPYVEAILAATDPADLINPNSKKATSGATREQADRMKAEMASEMPWVLEENWPEHRHWLISQTGLDPDRLRLSEFATEELTLGAARQGLGLNVSSFALVEDDLRQGRLRIAFEGEADGPAYYIVSAPGALRPSARTFIRWLKAVV